MTDVVASQEACPSDDGLGWEGCNRLGVGFEVCPPGFLLCHKSMMQKLFIVLSSTLLRIRRQQAARMKCCFGGACRYISDLPAIYVIPAALLLLVQLALSSPGNHVIGSIGWSTLTCQKLPM